MLPQWLVVTIVAVVFAILIAGVVGVCTGRF